MKFFETPSFFEAGKSEVQAVLKDGLDKIGEAGNYYADIVSGLRAKTDESVRQSEEYDQLLQTIKDIERELDENRMTFDDYRQQLEKL